MNMLCNVCVYIGRNCENVRKFFRNPHTIFSMFSRVCLKQFFLAPGFAVCRQCCRSRLSLQVHSHRVFSSACAVLRERPAVSRLRNKRVPSRQLAASSMAQMSAPETTCAAGNPLLSVSSSCVDVHRC